MDKARLVDPVHHTHAEGLANLGSDAERAIGLTDSEHGRRLAVHLDAATSEIENCLRRRGVSRHRCGYCLTATSRRKPAGKVPYPSTPPRYHSTSPLHLA